MLDRFSPAAGRQGSSVHISSPESCARDDSPLGQQNTTRTRCTYTNSRFKVRCSLNIMHNAWACVLVRSVFIYFFRLLYSFPVWGTPSNCWSALYFSFLFQRVTLLGENRRFSLRYCWPTILITVHLNAVCFLRRFPQFYDRAHGIKSVFGAIRGDPNTRDPDNVSAFGDPSWSS